MQNNTLDGKRIIFIGNSYVFYGNAVIRVGCDKIEESDRQNDLGYFYQLCRLNGESVSVTNWTFGGHGLSDIFGGTCGMSKKECCGQNHEAYLENRYYDYVIVSPSGGRRSADRFFTDMRYIKAFFERENPNAKFVCLGNLGAHGYSSFKLDLPLIYNSYGKLSHEGWIIADWGGIVNGILDGKTKLDYEGEPINKDSFIVNRTENDGFHPNMLSGYITALVAYCAITQKRALGQPYSFATDKNLAKEFDTDTYITEKYAYNGGKTNFHKLLNSEPFIRAIQKQIDITLFP